MMAAVALVRLLDNDAPMGAIVTNGIQANAGSAQGLSKGLGHTAVINQSGLRPLGQSGQRRKDSMQKIRLSLTYGRQNPR